MNIFIAEINPITFYPLLGICLLFLLIGLCLALINKFASKYFNLAKIICGVLALCAFAVTIWLMTKYYLSDVKDGGYYTNVSTLWLTLSSVGLVLLLAILLFFFSKKITADHTKKIVFGAVSIALAYALSYVRLFRMPQGGSITLCSLLPIMIYSYYFGTRNGVTVGLIYGFLQAITDAWIIHPMQFLLDYPIAFSFIGLAGIFKEHKILDKIPALQLILGGIIGSILRYLSHVLSGIFAFEVYAPEGFSGVAWGFLYNTFAFVDIAIALVAGGILFVNRRLVKQLDKFATVQKGFSIKDKNINSDNTPSNENPNEVINENTENILSESSTNNLTCKDCCEVKDNTTTND